MKIKCPHCEKEFSVNVNNIALDLEINNNEELDKDKMCDEKSDSQIEFDFMNKKTN